MGYTGITTKILTQKKKFQKLIVFNLLEACQCGICHEFLSVPMMISCGHNYCYRCLKNWFMTNVNKELNCPNCRESVVNEPCLNLMIEQTLASLFEVLKARKKKMFKEEKERADLDELLRERFDDSFYHKNDKNQGTLFDGVFKNSAVAIADADDDGIPRCSNCHWELEPEDMEDENICPHCHARIRNNASSLGNPNSINLNGRPTMMGNRDDYSDGEYDQIVDEIRSYNPSDVDSSGESDSSESVGYGHEDREEEDENKEEHDSDLDSFVVDDDEEEGAGDSVNGAINLAANQGPVNLSSEEDKDSDFYEHHDSDGFVSGDSLAESDNEAPVIQKRPVILDDEDDDDEDVVSVNQRSKRQRRELVLSDDE